MTTCLGTSWCGQLKLLCFFQSANLVIDLSCIRQTIDGVLPCSDIVVDDYVSTGQLPNQHTSYVWFSRILVEAQILFAKKCTSAGIKKHCAKPLFNKLCLIFFIFNTLTSGLIQAVRKNTADSHVALRGNISAPVWVTDLVKASKDVASLVVCIRKNIFCLGGAGLLSVTS